MNGQYLMNKQVSVQYAYKKDGKGERHGDDAERMLAAQARKHNVQPPPQQVAPNAFTGAGPGSTNLPITNGGDISRAANPGSSAAEIGVNRGMPPLGFPAAPQNRPPPLPSSLATPPPGLPARPPPSQAGYGGPQSFMAPGYNGAAQPPAFAPPSAPPPGFGPPPPAFASSGSSGPPPPLPPGFQHPGYGNAR